MKTDVGGSLGSWNNSRVLWDVRRKDGGTRDRTGMS